MEIPTLSREKYFLLLVDDFLRKQWVCFMNKEFDYFSNFVPWKALLEKQTSLYTKYLRYDNEGNFV